MRIGRLVLVGSLEVGRLERDVIAVFMMMCLVSEVQIQLIGSLARDQNAAGGFSRLAASTVVFELFLLDLLEVVLGSTLELSGTVFIRLV